MSNCNSNSNINKTFIIEPLSITGGNETLSACTTMFTNYIESCSGDTFISLGTGVVTFNSNVIGINGLTASTIDAANILSGGTNILDIFESRDNYTTGTTLVGTTLYFDRSDSLSAYTADLSSFLDDTNFYTTAATLDGQTVYFDRNDTQSAYTLDLSAIKFTGNTSADCITDIYVSNIHSCSPLHINPNDEGKIYFGSTSGLTIDVSNPSLSIGGEDASDNTALQLYTSGTTQRAIRMRDQITNASFNMWTTTGSTGVNMLKLDEDTSGTTVAVFTREGRMGLGTETPITKLHIEDDTTNSLINLQSNDPRVNIRLNDSLTTNTAVIGASGNSITIGHISNGDKMIVDVNGHVSLGKQGVTHPLSNLDILGTSGSTRFYSNGDYLPDGRYSNVMLMDSFNTPSGSTGIIVSNDVDNGSEGISIGALSTTRLDSLAGFGNNSDVFLYASSNANDLHIINNPGGSDNIKFWAGGSPATTTPTMVMAGTGATKGYVSIGKDNPQYPLDVNGETNISGRVRAVMFSGDGAELYNIPVSGITGLDSALTSYVQKSGSTMTGTLVLPSGSTTAPSLRIISGGTLLTTTQIGAFEFVGNTLYFTDGSNTRRNVLLGASGATATTLDSLTDTNVGGAGNGDIMYFDANSGLWRDTNVLSIDATGNTVTINNNLTATNISGDTVYIGGVDIYSSYTAHTADTSVHYTKSSINLSELGSSAHTHTLSEITDFNAYSAATDSKIGTKLDTSVFNTYSSNTESLINTKANQADLVTHTADTSIHYTKGSILLSELGSSAHTHSISEIDLLQPSLNAKFDKTGGTVNGNVIITGNVDILGTATTINTATLTVEDNIITLNSNATGTTAPIVDAGIATLRNSATTATLIWDESEDYWAAGLSGDTKRILLSGDSLSLLNSAHTHSISEITGLQTALDAKVESSLFNSYTSTTESLINTKANQADLVTHTADTSIHFTKGSINLSELATTAHTHSITDIVNLQTTLDDAETAFTAHTADTSVHYTKSSINLSDLGSSAHTHTLSEVTDFNAYSGSVQTALDGKAFQSDFVTHSADTSLHQNFYTTGATIIGTDIYVDRNDILSAYTVSVLPLNDIYANITGDTFTGSITAPSVSAQTISATTFYGDGSNLSGISTDNFYVTGGTYESSASTLTLTRNDAGVVTITGVTATPEALREENSLTTTGSSYETISTFTGVTNNTSRFIESYITAHRNGTDYGFWKRTLAVNNVTGNVTIEFESAELDAQSSGLTPSDVVYSAVGDTILARVSGEAAKTYEWTSTWEIIDEGIGGVSAVTTTVTGGTTFNPIVYEPTGTTITLDSSDSVVGVDSSAGATTITLPDSVATGNITYFVKDIGFLASSNNITINASGSDNIYYTSIVSSVTINTNGGAFILANNGAGSWYIM